jgi:tripartite-type tricarboxylate transporter receptor subunit TctC
MSALFASPEQSGPEALRRFVKSEVERWKAAMKSAGIQPE